MPLTTICRLAALAAGISICLTAYDESLQQRLNREFTLTKVTSDGSDVATAGTVVTLGKSGFMGYSNNSPVPYLNTYKNGKIGHRVGANLGAAFATVGSGGGAGVVTHKFNAGEKLWVIGLAIQKDGISFRLYSDAINNFHYYGDLKLPFEKKTTPGPDDAMRMISEVLTPQPADNQAPADTAPAVQTPPPPEQPSAPPVSIKLGDTKDQVLAALGQPKNIVNLGAKEMYIYSNLKITFMNGKVTDVQ